MRWIGIIIGIALIEGVPAFWGVPIRTDYIKGAIVMWLCICLMEIGYPKVMEIVKTYRAGKRYLNAMLSGQKVNKGKG